MENNNSFILKGNICFSKDKTHLTIADDSYVVCENGVSSGIFHSIPEQYQQLPLYDYHNQLILPGLVDLHVHAPQYSFRGLDMDMELIDWLNNRTFMEEQKYADLEYARRAYHIFVDDLVKSTTTRACIFATLHTPATLLLMDMLDKSGLYSYVGKVNMDRNAPDYLCEKSVYISEMDTDQWLTSSREKFQYCRPILTPRFIPSCSDELMLRLSRIQRKYKLPLQSHLSENPGEIQWVSELCPKSKFYGDAYDQFDLFGGEFPAIMAHCVYSTPQEIELIHKRNVFVAHCPQSNINLSSGIAPIRTYLDMGIHVGLGSDIAAGFSLSIFRAVADAIQSSKIRWRLLDSKLSPLKLEEAFYMATKGGGEFFGKVGSFEKGYDFDAIVVDDSQLRHPQPLSTRDRLERIIYLMEDRFLRTKYVQGRRIPLQ